MTREQEDEILKEIDYISDDAWSAVATSQLLTEEALEKINLLLKHLRILRDEIRKTRKELDGGQETN